jgi:hypothetical protein
MAGYCCIYLDCAFVWDVGISVWIWDGGRVMFNPGDTVRHINHKGCNAKVISVRGCEVELEIDGVKIKRYDSDLELVPKEELNK